MAFGFSALYFSDRLLVQWIPDQAILREVQMVKGGLEVVLTAVFIVFVTYRSRSRLTDENSRLSQMHRELGGGHRLIRHNLRNDLSVIQGYVTVAQDNCDSPKSMAACERVLNRSEEIEHYVDKTKQSRHIRDTARHQATVDFNTEIEATLGRLNVPESTQISQFQSEPILGITLLS